jgi:cytochrome P450
MLYALIFFLALLLGSVIQYSLKKRNNGREVPGPRGIPVLGNWFQIGSYPQYKIIEWAKQYGDIFKVRLGGQNWVFVNSHKAVRSIFDKHASITASKSPMPVVSDLVSGGKRFFLMSKDLKWRTLRTVIQSQLTPTKSDSFVQQQEIEACKLVESLLDCTDQLGFYQHVRAYTLGIMMRVVYGRGLRSSEGARAPISQESEMNQIYDILQDFSEVTFSSPYLADIFPCLTKLPSWLQWWHRSADERYERQKRLWMSFWQDLKDRIAMGNSLTSDEPSCLGKQWLSVSMPEYISDEQLAFFAGSKNPILMLVE